MNRALRLAAIAAVGLLAGLLLVVAGLAVRLAKGPIPLDFLTPRIVRALRTPAKSVAVTLGSTMLAWDRQDHQLDVRINDVKLTAADGTPIVTIPALAVWPRLSALLRGRVELVRVDIIKPQLRLTRQPDGQLRVAFNNAAASGADDAATSLVAGALAGSGTTRSPTLPFDAIGVRNATVTLDDRATRHTWQVKDVDCKLRRAAAGLAATIAAKIGGGDARATLHASAAYAAGPDVLTIDAVRLNLDTATIRARATVQNLRTAASLRLDASADAVQVDKLGRYWPAGVAADARSWVVANISAGAVHAATVHLTAHRRDDGSGFVMDDMSGAGAFENLSVLYLSSMPPVTKVAGTASFSQSAARFDVSRGTVSGVNVMHGGVDITGFAGAPRIAIDASVQGALSDVLTAMANQPFELPQKIGIAPGDARGTVNAELQFDFPLRRPLDRNQLGVRVMASLQQVAVPMPQRAGWEASDGNLRLTLSDALLQIEGLIRVRTVATPASPGAPVAGSVAGVPVELTLRHTLTSDQSPDIELQARLDQPERAALEIDPGAWLDGPIGVTAHVFADRNGSQRLSLDIDLRDAALGIPLIPKPRGESGQLQGEVLLGRGGVTAVNAIKFSTPRVSVSGNIQRSVAGVWDTANLDAVFVPAGGSGDPGGAHLRLEPARTGESFTLSSDDAGALLRSLGYDRVTGGKLDFAGTVRLSEPGLPLDGQIDVEKFNVIRAPILARIAGLASVRGIAERLSSGRGIRFDRARAGVSHARRIITIRDGAARGPSLALFIDGTVSQPTDTLDLRGRMIPSLYGLNEAPGRIPFIGDFLSGGDRALATFDFSVSGRIDNPDVHVSNVQSMAPALVRDLLHKLW